jgi:ketosteroid isomerase-like protein
MNNCETIVRKFAEAINSRDANKLSDLMTEDHRFIDSMGTVVDGRERMRQGWIGYYEMVPDYKIKMEEAVVSGNVVIMIGKAMGTYTSDGTLKPENCWETIAAWRAIVEGDKIKQWQVIADNEPIRAIIRREQSG